MPNINSETGHAKNVATFEDLISFCVAYGEVYNPAKAALTIEGLTNLHADAKSAMLVLYRETSTLINAVNSRSALFNPLGALSTKIINALSASDVSPQTVKSAQTIIRKIQGKRAKVIHQPGPPPPGEEPAEIPATISVSQMSYDSRIANFERLIQLLDSQEGYNPNEVDLTIASLNALLSTLQSCNTDVINATTVVSNTRIERDTILYGPGKGLADISVAVKKYVKSVFGATSPQYRQWSNLYFKKRGD